MISTPMSMTKMKVMMYDDIWCIDGEEYEQLQALWWFDDIHTNDEEYEQYGDLMISTQMSD